MSSVNGTVLFLKAELFHHAHLDVIGHFPSDLGVLAFGLEHVAEFGLGVH